MAEGWIEFTTAPPGSGKSYRRGAWFVVEDWLLSDANGVFYTNIPLDIDAIIDYAKAQWSEKLADPERIRSMIHVITPRVVAQWMRGEGRPWDYFGRLDLKAGRIAIDEVHKVFPKNMSTEDAKNLTAWLGEFRHRHCRFEAISQHPDKVHRSIQENSEVRRYLTNMRNIRVPYVGITYGELANLRAAFGGKFLQLVQETVEVVVKEKWQAVESNIFPLTDKYFKLYDSYNNPNPHGEGVTESHKEDYQKYNRWLYLGVLFGRHGLRIMIAITVLVLLYYMLLGGGCQKTATGFIERMSQASVPLEGQEQIDPALSSEGPHLKKELQEFEELKADMLSQIDSLRAENQILQKRYVDIEEQLNLVYSVTGMTRNEIFTADGLRYSVGQSFDSGPHEGSRIVRIDWPNRRVICHDGTILRVGVRQ